MSLTAQQISQIVNGKIEGDPDVIVTGPSRIEEASEGHITFLANEKYEEHLYRSDPSVVLMSEAFMPKQEITATIIRVPDVYKALGILLETFGEDQHGSAGISEKSSIADSVRMGSGVTIGDFSVIEKDVIIGDHVVIYPQVYIGKNCRIDDYSVVYPGTKIYHGCTVGRRCIIHANSVIGSDGFGFSKDGEGKYKKIPQLGNVVLEDDVEVGANTCIDRATMGSTIIHKGVKLDNLIQIAHNVSIGENSAVAAQAGIAGSSKIGKNVLVGGQVGIVGHIEVADGAQIQAKSGIAGNVREENARLYGYPAIEYYQYLRAYAVMKNLPELAKKLRELESDVQKLSQHRNPEDNPGE